MLALLALLVGEALLLCGLWLIFPPAAFLAAGVQLVAVGLVREVTVKVTKR